MKNQLILGIDPGTHGAVSVLMNGHSAVFDLPVTDTTYFIKQKSRIDLIPLYNFFRKVFSSYVRFFSHRSNKKANKTRPTVLVALELSQSQGFGRASAAVMMNIADGAALIEAALVLAAEEEDVLLLIKKHKPAIWLPWLFPGIKRKGVRTNSDKKDTSLSLARQLFPSLSDKLSRKKDDGRAEALLLAMIGAAEMCGCWIDDAKVKEEDRLERLMSNYRFKEESMFLEYYKSFKLVGFPNLQKFITYKLAQERLT